MPSDPEPRWSRDFVRPSGNYKVTQNGSKKQPIRDFVKSAIADQGIQASNRFILLLFQKSREKCRPALNIVTQNHESLTNKGLQAASYGDLLNHATHLAFKM